VIVSDDNADGLALKCFRHVATLLELFSDGF